MQLTRQDCLNECPLTEVVHLHDPPVQLGRDVLEVAKLQDSRCQDQYVNVPKCLGGLLHL